MSKVIIPPMPKGSKLAKCPHCNAIFTATPEEFKLLCGDVMVFCPCCVSPISISKAIEL